MPKKRVLLRAPLLTVSGYGVHSRQIFEYLYEQSDVDLHVEVLNWGQTSWMINTESEDGLIGKIMSCSKKLEPPYDYTFQVQLPDEWNPRLGKKNIGISAFVETDRCNPAWISKCNEMDLVVAPSTFTKEVVTRSGYVTKPFYVVPEWFNSFLNKDIESDLQVVAEEKFNFITPFNLMLLGQLTGHDPWSDRKNIFFTIKWFFETFADRPDVGLILKTNSGKSTLIDKRITESVVQGLIKETRKGPFPRVHLLHGNLTSEEVASLYHHPRVFGFISATRGEGYGLPLVDAAASGVPVLATNWSGHLEFLKEGLFAGVDYKLKDIPKNKIDNRIFFEGTKWAEVDETDFKKKLRALFEDMDTARNNAVELKDIVQAKFSKEAVSKRYTQILKKHFRW